MRNANLIAALLAAGCGGERFPSAPVFPATAILGTVDGVRVVALPDVNFPIERSGLLDEVARAVGEGERYWGAPTGLLDGWTVAFNGGWFACFGTWTWGCTKVDEGVIYAAPGWNGCRTSAILHEVGHVLIGDPDHHDPRWRPLLPPVVQQRGSLEDAPCGG